MNKDMQLTKMYYEQGHVTTKKYAKNVLKSVRKGHSN